MLFSKIITTSGRYVKGDHPHFIEKIAIYLFVLGTFLTQLFTLHTPHSTPVNNSFTAPLSRKANEHFNPPIRGSIAVTINIEKFGKIFAYQSPYKGFNSEYSGDSMFTSEEYQSPYKGFNRHHNIHDR